MGKRTQLILYGILTNLFIIVFLANLDSIGGHIDSATGSRIEEAVNRIDRAYLFAIKMLIYFCSFLFAYKKYAQTPWLTFVCLLIPVILIDATVFIDGISLIPLRFPFETLFPALGLLGGVIKVGSQKKYFLLYAAFMVLFVFLSKRLIIPAIINHIEKRESRKIVNHPPFGNGYYLTVTGDSTRLEDTANTKCTLLELYFVGCLPCEQKLPVLAELYKETGSTQFRVILICNGLITNFQKFLQHARRNEQPGFTFLYDNRGNIEKMTSSTGFPYEMLVTKEGQIISSFAGFNTETSAMYITDDLKTIKQILNE